jgi:hypothetical protein
MFDQMTFADIPNAISSQDSADGLPHFAAQDGPMTDLFGPVPVRANLSARQAKDLGLLTSGIYGPHGTGSSKSVALQESLVSRLRPLLTGSVSCEVTWKRWDTPWGQSLSKPRARVRTTFEIVIGLWPTVTCDSVTDRTKRYAQGGMPLAALMIALHPTPTVHGNYNRKGLSPNSGDGLHTHVIALWSTIRASDGAKGGPNMSFGAGGSPLPSQVSTVADTSNATMESGGGSLHPEFAGWEMGYPPEWLSCAPSETPSTRGQQHRSSKQLMKP